MRISNGRGQRGLVLGRRRGSALVYGLVITFAVQILLVSLMGFITSNIRYSLQIRSREEAFQIAEAAIDHYRWYLAHNVEGKTTSQIQAFWDGGTARGVGAPYEADYSDPVDGVIGRYRVEVTPPESGSTIAIVKATGWTYRYPALTRVLQVRLRRPSWSEHAVLANDFMRFGSGTNTYGKIHSNAGIRFDGVAHNIVTSSVCNYNDPDHSGGNELGVHTHVSPTDPLPTCPDAVPPTRTDVFQAGRSVEVTTVDFNGVLGDLNYMKSESQSGNGVYFTGTGVNNRGTQIELRTDGTFRARQVRTYSGAYSITAYNGAWATYTIPDDGIIFVEDNVWLSGTISDQKVTVVAADLVGGPAPSVYILNDIRYTNADGRDIIGVIAQNNIEIGWASENDLRIDAALLAQQGRVGREHYTSKGYSPDSKSVITVNGAIATNLRYGFAWTDGTGYTTRNIYYDNNLLYYPPPYFPTGTEYEMDLWEEL